MPCFRPLDAWRSKDGPIVFSPGGGLLVFVSSCRVANVLVVGLSGRVSGLLGAFTKRRCTRIIVTLR